MSKNFLKFNNQKTEFVVFKPRPRSLSSQDCTIHIGDTTPSPVSHVLNLGVIQDSFLTMERQVNTISKACYHQIQNIGKIRRTIHWYMQDPCTGNHHLAPGLCQCVVILPPPLTARQASACSTCSLAPHHKDLQAASRYTNVDPPSLTPSGTLGSLQGAAVHIQSRARNCTILHLWICG